MSFKLNNTTLRNLEEQVQKNKEDIANHYAIDRALANLGIEVVGQITTADLLPDPLTYTGEYGYTYAVGNKEEVDAGNATYDYYVYTRPDPNAGQPNNYWLNVGKISIAGPIGPQGPQGEQGPEGKSTKWYYGDDIYSSADEGDFLLTSAGLVYEYVNDQWAYKTNIRGPQGPQGIQGQQGPQGEVGPQGPKGEKGDVGGFINIRGILNNIDQLPLPSTVNDLTVAYLIGETEPYTLYIQVGETSNDAIWNDVGPLNAATLVTSGGEYQNIWDADTKLDKLTPSEISGYTEVYGMKGGSQTNPLRIGVRTLSSSGTNLNDAIPKYIYEDGDSHLTTGIPTKDTHCTNKKYVDDIAAGKLDKTTNTYQVYCTDGNGEQITRTCAWSATSGNLPLYDDNRGSGGYDNEGNLITTTSGALITGVPFYPKHATPKQWVEDNFVKSATLDTGTYVYVRQGGVNTVLKRTSVGNDTDSLVGLIPTYTNTNQLTTGTPTTDYSCTNKKYVDNFISYKTFRTLNELTTYLSGSTIKQCCCAFGAAVELNSSVTIPNYTKGWILYAGADAVLNLISSDGTLYTVYYDGSNGTFRAKTHS